MGSSYWRVTVPLESTIEDAFARARQDVFRAKDYVGASSEHASIESAVEAAEAAGTHSILDLDWISSVSSWVSRHRLTCRQNSSC